MSGVITAAVVTAAAAAVAGTAYSVVANEQGKKAQQNAMNQQQQAQNQAIAQAQMQASKSQEAINAANRKAPDVSGILSSAARQASGGPSGTILTGPGGVNPAQLPLGRSTLLGQ